MIGKLRNLFRTKEPTISREESLKGVPVISVGVTREEGPDGECMLFMPRQQSFPRLAKFFGAPRDIPPGRLILDELGNRVWKKIDGRRNVKQIVKLFAGETGLHRREAEVSVVDFLNSLMKRGLISIAFK